MQTTAATMPPSAPAASDSGVTCSVSAVVPTASDPPGAQAGHHQRRVGDGAGDAEDAADDREHQAFGREQPADARRREADGAQQADLADALLDAELEEQRREQQRRDDEEEAEVGEVLAEVGGAARRGRAPRSRTSRTARPSAIGSILRAQRVHERSRASPATCRRRIDDATDVTAP